MKPGDVVLVDTNVIIEGHLKACWKALTGQFLIETVDHCVLEAMSGQYDWKGSRPAEGELRSTFNCIHDVTIEQLAHVKISGGSVLDAGEQALWAHALGRDDTWILCGPDRASMRFGYEQGKRERLVSLGGLLQVAGFKPPSELRPHFEQHWLDEVIRKLILGML